MRYANQKYHWISCFCFFWLLRRCIAPRKKLSWWLEDQTDVQDVTDLRRACKAPFDVKLLYWRLMADSDLLSRKSRPLCAAAEMTSVAFRQSLLALVLFLEVRSCAMMEMYFMTPLTSIFCHQISKYWCKWGVLWLDHWSYIWRQSHHIVHVVEICLFKNSADCWHAAT